MNRFRFTCLLSALVGAAGCQSSGTTPPGADRTLLWETFVDKVDGGWLGQMIGVTFAAATEFRWQGRMIPFDISTYIRPRPGVRDSTQAMSVTERMDYLADSGRWESFTPDGAQDQDDTYIELMFLDALKTHGLDLSPKQTAEHWLKYMNYDRVWHANKAAHTNFRNGIWPPASGSREHNAHWEDIDFQIEADLFGLLCPGLPRESNALGARFGTLMNSEEGLYGGLFVAAMYTLAFFEQDPAAIVGWGLRAIPSNSRYAAMVQYVLDGHAAGTAWESVWQGLETRWGQSDTCPNGRGTVFNIDAGMNGAYIVMGLLYGSGDFERTMNVAARCGQDSDCNPSNAAGILGTVLGASGIPERFRAPMQDFVHNHSMAEIYPARIPRPQIIEDTIEIAAQVIQRAGGAIITDNAGRKVVRIPFQDPAPPGD